VVSLGTVFTLAAIGAIAAGGYALYRNAGAITSALSRGVEGYLTNPLGSYFENLFQNLPIPPVVGSTNGTVPPPPGPGEEGTGIWQGTEGSDQGPKLPADKNLAQVAFDIWWLEHFGPGPSTTTPPATTPPVQDLTPPGPIPQSTAPQYDAGYYYVNYEGSQYDTQWYLTAGQAQEAAKTAAAPGDAFLGIKYVGQSALSKLGFETFGKSQNYL